mgnify:CR=1 FL=1
MSSYGDAYYSESHSLLLSLSSKSLPFKHHQNFQKLKKVHSPNWHYTAYQCQLSSSFVMACHIIYWMINAQSTMWMMSNTQRKSQERKRLILSSNGPFQCSIMESALLLLILSSYQLLSCQLGLVVMGTALI